MRKIMTAFAATALLGASFAPTLPALAQTTQTTQTTGESDAGQAQAPRRDYRPGKSWGAKPDASSFRRGLYTSGYSNERMMAESAGSSTTLAGSSARSSGSAERCAARWRSYDPATNTYTTYDGRQVECRL